MTTLGAVRLALIAALAASAMAAGTAWAQSQRDPTEPPPVVAAPAGNATGAAAREGDVPARAILVRDGKPYLVVGTRLYGQGQQLGRARIERISETEVWLREEGVLRKWTPFAGIQRHTVPPVASP